MSYVPSGGTVADFKVLRRDIDAAHVEIARLTAELAAARAVPGDVEAAIQAFDDACDAVGMYTAGPKDLTAEIRLYKDHDDARDRLRTAIARAISDATAARGTVGGLLAMAPRCSCTHEAGDSICDAHPSCSECGDSTSRNVDDCADHCQVCASLRRGHAITDWTAMCSACKARGPLPKGG